jgi:hypothetical protein
MIFAEINPALISCHFCNTVQKSVAGTRKGLGGDWFRGRKFIQVNVDAGLKGDLRSADEESLGGLVCTIN